MKINLLAWGVALAACAPLLATAQTAKTELPRPNAPLTYRSAFTDYKPYKEAPLANWRELNDTVAGTSGGAGGHAGHHMGGTKDMVGLPAAPAAPASGAMTIKPSPVNDAHPKKGGTP